MTSKDESFEFSFQKVLEAEGGFVDHKADRGGVTNFGVTKTTYTYFLGRPATDEEMKSMTLDRARDVYYALFWNPLNLAQVRNRKLACIIFDQAVNRGPRVAIRKLQATINQRIKGTDIAEDGVLGVRTISIINSCEPKSLALWYVCASQLDYARIVEFNSSQSVFLRGWLRRTHLLFEMMFLAEGEKNGEKNENSF